MMTRDTVSLGQEKTDQELYEAFKATYPEKSQDFGAFVLFAKEIRNATNPKLPELKNELAAELIEWKAESQRQKFRDVYDTAMDKIHEAMDRSDAKTTSLERAIAHAAVEADADVRNYKLQLKVNRLIERYNGLGKGKLSLISAEGLPICGTDAGGELVAAYLSSAEQLLASQPNKGKIAGTEYISIKDMSDNQKIIIPVPNGEDTCNTAFLADGCKPTSLYKQFTGKQATLTAAITGNSDLKPKVLIAQAKDEKGKYQVTDAAKADETGYHQYNKELPEDIERISNYPFVFRQIAEKLGIGVKKIEIGASDGTMHQIVIDPLKTNVFYLKLAPSN